MTKPTATISLDEVRKVAQLARLDVQEDELARLQAQLENILNYMSELNDVDVSRRCVKMSHTLCRFRARPFCRKRRPLPIMALRCPRFWKIPR